MSKSKAKKQKEFEAMIAECVKNSNRRKKDSVENLIWRKQYCKGLRSNIKLFLKLN